MNQVKVTGRVQKQLFELQDLQYRDFQAKLLPTIEKETVIGVRMPVLRKFAKGYGKTEEAKEFLKILPHQYYDENNLHGLLIEQIKDYDRCLAELERFLPYIDNWATCDMLAVKVMKNHLDTFIEEVCHWMKSDRTYTIRFGIGMLMRYYLGDEFRIEYPRKVALVQSDEYYVNMMRAWYFATALAKQPDAALPWLTERRLDVWTHNKTIQKDNRPPAKKQTVCLYHSLRFLQQTALFYFPSTIFFSLSIRMIVSSTVRTAHMIVLSPATQPTISWNPITSSASATAIAIPETVLITRIFCAISMET